jgi:membrane associated rhomboid family serine protease
MIPLRDVMPSPRVPLVTVALIAAHLIVWLSGGLWPRGAFTPNPPDLADGWHHTTGLHLVANLWCLWIFGDNIEGRIGRLPFLAAYVLYGICALLLERALTPPVEPLVMLASGASGAIAGVMGMYFAWYPRSRVLTLFPSLAGWDLLELPAAALLAMWFTLQLIALNALTGTGAPALAAIAAMFAAGAGGGLLLGRSRRYPTW